MSIDDAIQSRLDALFDRLHADHMRELAISLHKVDIARVTAEHLGVPDLPAEPDVVVQARAELNAVNPANPNPVPPQ